MYYLARTYDGSLKINDLQNLKAVKDKIGKAIRLYQDIDCDDGFYALLKMCKKVVDDYDQGKDILNEIFNNNLRTISAFREIFCKYILALTPDEKNTKINDVLLGKYVYYDGSYRLAPSNIPPESPISTSDEEISVERGILNKP